MINDQLLVEQILLRTSAKNSLYKSGKTFLWVSTTCVQILRLSNIRVTVRPRVRFRVRIRFRVRLRVSLV